jgi:hypothetical protein
MGEITELMIEPAEAVGRVYGFAWTDGLYKAACGCVHRFHTGDDLPDLCHHHGCEVTWVLKQKY